MDGMLGAQVGQEVSAWLAWLPRWQPGSHRGRLRVCRTCFGSPILTAAGLLDGIPHGVQHPFSMRMKGIIDRAVDQYTERNLPLLQHELEIAEQRKAARKFRAGEGLDPEFQGLAPDPEPVPGQPFLFTIAELEHESTVEAEPDEVPLPLTDSQKVALRREIELVDEFSTMIGRQICAEISGHRERIARGVTECIEPIMDRLMAELTRDLDWDPPTAE